MGSGRGIGGLKMGQMVQKWDTLAELFYNFPQKEFHIRELARTAKIPKSTLHREIKNLLSAGLIKKRREYLILFMSQMKLTSGISLEKGKV